MSWIPLEDMSVGLHFDGISIGIDHEPETPGGVARVKESDRGLSMSPMQMLERRRTS